MVKCFIICDSASAVLQLLTEGKLISCGLCSLVHRMLASSSIRVSLLSMQIYCDDPTPCPLLQIDHTSHKACLCIITSMCFLCLGCSMRVCAGLGLNMSTCLYIQTTWAISTCNS